MQLIIHTDGGARGNPGPAAVGVVIERVEHGGDPSTSSAQATEVARFGKKIGETTNNVAEYTAVIEALRWIKTNEKNESSIHFYLDSMLVVNQLNGLFKVKSGHLRELLSQVRLLEQEVGGSIVYTSIPREQNHRADALVNRALDGIYP